MNEKYAPAEVEAAAQAHWAATDAYRVTKPKEHKFGPWKGYQQIGYECANVSSDTFELFGEAALEYSTDPGRKVLLRFFSIGTDPDGGGSCSSNICSGTPKMVNPPYSCTPCS